MKKLSIILLATSMVCGALSYAEYSPEQKAAYKQHKEEMKAKIKEICKTDKEKCRAIKARKKELKAQAKEQCKSSADQKACMKEFKMQHKGEMQAMIEGTPATSQTPVQK